MRYIAFLFWWEKKMTACVKDGDIQKVNIILNLEVWKLNQKAHAGQTSKNCIEIAKDPKGYKMQAEKVPVLIFKSKL
jgi:hypothetical protein